MLAQPPSQFHDSTTYSKQHRRSIRPLRHRKPNAQSNPSVVKTRLTSVLTIVAALVGFAFAGVQSTQAAILVVNSTADTNVCDNTTCTLRGAINVANANPGADTITFSITGTILLGSALPNLSDDVTISGPGANALTVNRDPSAAGFIRIFTVDTGKSVTISGLTISCGNTAGGGGIANLGTLTVSNCTVSGNSSTFIAGGGGIYNSSTLTVSNSTLSNNSSTTDGGGIYNDDGTVTVSNSTLWNNSSSGSGGGIFNHVRLFGATLTVSNSTLSDNSAGSGGGIFNDATGTLNLSSSIVANDTATFGPDVLGTVASGDYNLVKNTSGATLSGTHNITGVDPKLGGLAYYGGPTA